MATPATLTFTALTNARIWFASPAAFNNWVGAITVSITGANLPDATTTTLGGVKKLEIAEFSAPARTTEYINLVLDDGATQEEVPSREDYDSLVAQVTNLNNYITSLYAQLAAKGYV